MLFTDFLKERNLLPDKQNLSSNPQQGLCIIRNKQNQRISSSTPMHQSNHQKQTYDARMFGSTPLSPPKVPDIQYISNLLKKKKSIAKSCPKKTAEGQVPQTQLLKKLPAKLCLNCENFVQCLQTSTHEKQCKDFDKLLLLSRNQLRDLINAKMLANKARLQDTKRQSEEGDTSVWEWKINHLAKMKMRLEAKMGIKPQ